MVRRARELARTVIGASEELELASAYEPGLCQHSLCPSSLRVEIGLIAPFALDALQYRHYGKYRSRDHRSATALHHVFTAVYDTWGGGRTTAVAAPTGSCVHGMLYSTHPPIH